MFASVVRSSAVRGRRVLLITVLVAVLSALAGSTLMSRMSSNTDAPNAESVQAAKRLTEASGMSVDVDVIAIVSPKGGLNSREGRLRFSEVATELYTLPGAVRVQSYLNSPDPSLVSKDARAGLIAIQFAADIDRRATAKKVAALVADQPDVALTGASVMSGEIQDRVENDLSSAELFGLPLLFLFALWIFRSVVAAGVTVAIGVLAILVTLGVLRLIAAQVELSSFTLNLVTGLGLGLSIDYCLFIISRYREEAAVRGYTVESAISAGMAAGRTVLFSALTVAASAASLMLFPHRFLFSMGIGGAVVTLVAALVSVIVLPAVLALLGPRIDALGLPGARRALESDTGDVSGVVWYHLARWVMRHAPVVLAGVAVVVVVLLSPAFNVRFSNIDIKSLPLTSSSREATVRVADGFAGGGTTTVNVAVFAGQDHKNELTRYAAQVAGVPGVDGVTPPTYLGPDTWLINAEVKAEPFSDKAQKVVHGIRALPSPTTTLVGGASALFVDNEELIGHRLPWALLLVGVAVLLLVFLLTGSLVLAVKTFIVNILNVLMTLGVLVWIFQEGHLSSILDFTSTGAIDLGTPILVIVVGFGLSTDYGVFLLARIKESFDHNPDNDEAVAAGVGRTGRIISSAAVLMCVAIGAFSTSSVLFIKQLGVGIAVSVVLDATVIRAFLVPAAMKLMATINWWSPAALRKVHDRFGISEAPSVHSPQKESELVSAVATPLAAPAQAETAPESTSEIAAAAFVAAAFADIATKLADAGWTAPTLSGAPSGPPKLRLIESPDFDDERPLLTVVPAPEDVDSSRAAEPAATSPFRASAVHASLDGDAPPSRHRVADALEPMAKPASRGRGKNRYFRKPAHMRGEEGPRKASGRHRR